MKLTEIRPYLEINFEEYLKNDILVNRIDHDVQGALNVQQYPLACCCNNTKIT